MGKAYLHDARTPLCTPAELSLGLVLDALPEDSPWLARLERADEDWGRPIGDHLRLRRWCSVLVDMHFPGLAAKERSAVVERYFAEVWKAYQRVRAEP